MALSEGKYPVIDVTTDVFAIISSPGTCFYSLIYSFFLSFFSLLIFIYLKGKNLDY